MKRSIKKMIANISAKFSFLKGESAYDNGNYNKAAQFYKKACNSGFAIGCNNLGVLYRDGQGIEQNYSKAAELFKQACDGGIALGYYNLGALYDRGQEKSGKRGSNLCLTLGAKNRIELFYVKTAKNTVLWGMDFRVMERLCE